MGDCIEFRTSGEGWTLLFRLAATRALGLGGPAVDADGHGTNDASRIMSEAIVAHGTASAARRSALRGVGGRSARPPFGNGSHDRL